jgi:hypothetical protein
MVVTGAATAISLAMIVLALAQPRMVSGITPTRIEGLVMGDKGIVVTRIIRLPGLWPFHAA